MNYTLMDNMTLHLLMIWSKITSNLVSVFIFIQRNFLLEFQVPKPSHLI